MAFEKYFHIVWCTMMMMMTNHKQFMEFSNKSTVGRPKGTLYFMTDCDFVVLRTGMQVFAACNTTYQLHICILNNFLFK